MKKHAKYSASAAERWVMCPASVALSEQSPQILDNEYGISGTATHTCLETLLNNHTGMTKIAGYLRQVYPDDMVSRAEKAAALILGMWFKHHDSELLFETRVKLEHIHPDFGGTFDAGIVALFDRLIIVDYKDGTKPVSPDHNLQMTIYALGLAHEHNFNFAQVDMAIIQPRAKGSLKKPMRIYTMTIEELEKYDDFFKRAIDAAESPRAKFNPGAHCYWCPGRFNCTAKRKEDLAKAGNDFPDEY